MRTKDSAKRYILAINEHNNGTTWRAAKERYNLGHNYAYFDTENENIASAIITISNYFTNEK